tara:strand:+ start:183 stop:893 length:711 start_codon:yes stop_codon:yes gene_type:complete
MLYLSIKVVGRVFYRPMLRHLTPYSRSDWKEIKLICFLNHTSLYEPLFFSVLPVSFLWKCAGDVVIPVADKTVNRPLVGQIFNAIAPKMVSISRKRDETWEEFMNLVRSGYLVTIFPEGRMKRANGLDSNGKPMSVKGGIYDILNLIKEGKMIVAYSGGLHHIQVPEEGLLPKLFKNLKVNIEILSIEDFKKPFYEEAKDARHGRMALIQELETRMKVNCPPAEFPYPEMESPQSI